MASSISHDLRHPLTAVNAYAEFLARSDLTPEQRADFYHEIQIAVNRMTDQIGSLLGFSRRGDALQLAETSLDVPIARAIQTVRVLPEFDGIAITSTCETECRARVDAAQIERVILNLLFNACEAVSPPDGAVEIEGRVVGTNVVVRVSDNGTGIPDSIRDRLFEPFVSANKETGIGLGLTAVHMIVQEHGGRVELERSERGVTTFRVTLPTAGPDSNARTLHNSLTED